MEEKHVVMFSGGASSAYVAKWVADKYGQENTMLFFTDTLWEDKDNLRFMDDISEYLGIEITKRVDGRTPEDIFFEQKFLGNARFAKCSEELKVKQTQEFLYDLANQDLAIYLYFGIGPHEAHRAESLTHHYTALEVTGVKIEVRFPMIDSISSEVKARNVIEHEWGIELPRMYKEGFHHANCSGKCVRGGLHHFANLFLERPEEFAELEDMENRFREKFNYDVSIMKKNGVPYRLKTYREEVLEKMPRDELVEYAKVKDTDNIPCFCSFS